MSSGDDENAASVGGVSGAFDAGGASYDADVGVDREASAAGSGACGVDASGAAGAEASTPHATNATNATNATLNAWRERHADRHDPVRFHFIDALARRAANHSGAARRILDARLATLIEAYAEDLERAEPGGDMPTVAEPARGALAALTDHLASHAPTADDPRVIAHGLPSAASYPALPALDHFREIWSKVRTEKQLRESFEQVPGNAGPLNSSSLVHRSLSLMRELSPGYLKQFLAYVDALTWMEQMNGGAAAGKDAPRAASAGKSARGKAR